MEKKIPVGVSNHHIHLTSDDYNKLFKNLIKKRNELHQPKEFASEQLLRVKTAKGVIENIRVIGPFRDYTQLEITRSDAYVLGINPPVNRSGYLEKSDKITLIGDKGELTLDNCCIIAQRHVHMSLEEAEILGVIDNQKVQIKVEGDKSAILDAYVKISDKAFLEVHLDFDDANAMGLKNGDEVLLIV